MFPDLITVRISTQSLVSVWPDITENCDTMGNKTSKATGNQTSNAFGQVYCYPRRRVHQIEDLKPGDHIAVHGVVRAGQLDSLYKHHAIVINVEEITNMVTIINYAGDLGTTLIAAKASAIIREEEWNFEDQEIFLVVHPKGTCLEGDEVIKRAYKYVGQKGFDGREKYNFLFNNCEHFANWCKTGKAYCEQKLNLLRSAIRVLPTAAKPPAKGIFTTTIS